MPESRGFTLIELLTVIFMIGLFSAFAVPGIMSWRDAAKLRGAAENLKGNLELAKMRAIQQNAPVAVQIWSDRYRIFVDTGANDGELDADETLIKAVELLPGVRFDLNESTFASVDEEDSWPLKTRFRGRGTAASGKAVLTNSQRTKAKSLTVTALGKITLANFPLN